MARNFTTAGLGKATGLKKLQSSKNNTVINGQVINKKSSPEKYQIGRATSGLAARGIITQSSPETSVEQSAVDLLGTLGCSITAQTVEYSLLSQQTDIETIENANIFDENTYKQLQNKKVKATDKFVNVDDPFYKLDNPMPNKNTTQNTELVAKASTTNVKKLTSDLVSMNIDDTKATTLKQFRK